MVYSDVQMVNLYDYINYSKLRTVPADCSDVPKGISEIAMIIELKEDSKIKSKEGFPSCFINDDRIYGFLKTDVSFIQKTEGIKNIKKATILLNEFDSKSFLLIFKSAEGKQEPVFSVKTGDVLDMFTACQNPSGCS